MNRCIVCHGFGMFTPPPTKALKECVCVARPREEYSADEDGLVIWWSINPDYQPCMDVGDEDLDEEYTHFQRISNPTLFGADGKVCE